MKDELEGENYTRRDVLMIRPLALLKTTVAY